MARRGPCSVQLVTALVVCAACGGAGAADVPRARGGDAPVASEEPEAPARVAVEGPRLSDTPRLFWMARDGDRRRCVEWRRERERLSASQAAGGERAGYRVAWGDDGQGFTLTGAFVGERVLACRSEVQVVGSSATAVQTSAGDVYVSLGDCVGALSEAPSLEDTLSEHAAPAFDLGGCDGAIELLRDVRPAPDPDPIVALMAGGAEVHVLSSVEESLRCDAWRSVRRADRVDLVHRAEGGTATRGQLRYWNDERGPRLGSTAPAWRGDDGAVVALGSYEVRAVRFVDGGVFLVGGSPWFARAADCEAARALDGLPAWLRSRAR